MKTQIEDFLQKIDNNFKDKTQKDIYMTYVMVFGIIFAFAYLMFWDSSEADFNAKRAQVVSIESQIANDKRFLQLNPATKIIQIENDTKSIEKKMLAFKDNNQYIKTKIEEISSLIYDEQTWGKYLHSISKNAKANNVQILEFSNTYIDNQTSFGHILDINIKTSANFNNTLNFINSLEQSELVVDLHDFNIEALNIQALKKINSDLNISVWGIIY